MKGELALLIREKRGGGQNEPCVLGGGECKEGEKK